LSGISQMTSARPTSGRSDTHYTAPLLVPILILSLLRTETARSLYRRGGARALIPKKPTGRKSRATPEFIAQMKEAVRTNPLRLGYGFSTWSAARLAAHLAKTTRIRFSEDQTIRLLHDHGFSVQGRERLPGLTPANWRTAPSRATWRRWRRRPRRATTRRPQRVMTCRGCTTSFAAVT
jgi:transposase